jgi:hypothetical protein
MWRWMQRAAERMGLVDRLRAAWLHDVRRELKPLRDDLRSGLGRDVARLTADVERLHRQLAETADALASLTERHERRERQLAQAAAIARLNDKQRDLIARLPQVLDEARIRAHTTAAIAQAEVHDAPFPFMVVDNVVPADATVCCCAPSRRPNSSATRIRSSRTSESRSTRARPSRPRCGTSSMRRSCTARLCLP